jgi:hypothetical protein
MLSVLRRAITSPHQRRLMAQKTGHFFRCMAAVARHGLPAHYLYFGHAMGDDLLCTTVLRELRLRDLPRPWMGSLHPSLFEGNLDVARVVPMSYQFARTLQRLGKQVTYARYPVGGDTDDPATKPTEPLLVTMCRAAGVTGTITRRTYLHLSDAERAGGARFPTQVAMLSTGLKPHHPMLNKQWYVERFQEVAARLSRDVPVIQLGTLDDPPLGSATLDLRGKLTFRQSAAVLARSQLFIGTVGFLMHLARSVDCRSVIVFGGRESPDISGYSCNENLFSPVPCAPCWYDNRCAFNRKCMDQIGVDTVMAAVERLRTRLTSPPELQQDQITPA